MKNKIYANPLATIGIAGYSSTAMGVMIIDPTTGNNITGTDLFPLLASNVNNEPENKVIGVICPNSEFHELYEIFADDLDEEESDYYET